LAPLGPPAAVVDGGGAGRLASVVRLCCFQATVSARAETAIRDTVRFITASSFWITDA
jgi:hypothetical protein